MIKPPFKGHNSLEFQNKLIFFGELIYPYLKKKLLTITIK